MMPIHAHGMVRRTADGFHHPRSEQELAAFVRLARRQGQQLRVRGSAHSVRAAIFADPGLSNIDVMLDQYAGVVFDDQRCRVTVQAGCHLGVDPRDPTGTSTWGNSLLAQLDARGWALPDLGGVTHQTVSGFLMTGSCGGTTQHAIEDAVLALRLIDGTGTVHELERGRDELFEAALCSMGLLGVISTVTLQCVPRYDIIGEEHITSESDTAYSLFGDGHEGLDGFFRTSEYARLMWWPQEGVRQVVTWQARRMRDADYGAQTGPRGFLKPKRYSALGAEIDSPQLASLANQAAQIAGGLFYDGLALAARAKARLPSSVGTSRLRSAFANQLLPRVLRSFVSEGARQCFWDSWCHGLPLDNQISELSMPTDFTEIWLPLERAGEVMRALRSHYDRAGYDATGAFICEVYAARATRAWLHPAHHRDSLRIDLFWFRRNPGDPSRTYFEQFWRLLQPFGYRLHWGKILPADPALGEKYLRRQYPRWDDFLAARARLDPDGVFFTRYWRAALGVEGVAP
ncbi:MAG TPA: D-arabinono-1,4-lactone oxidase [Polyangiaceae bacterium]|nr:D-arabinono-1,4-lactone oxidase [Polyangiaceae bacterium]